MAILFHKRRIVPLDAVLEGLGRAADSVVRVQQRGEGNSQVCTGWFITPQLVLIPGFAVNPKDLPAKFRVQIVRGGKLHWEQEVMGQPEPLSPSFNYETQPIGVTLLQVATVEPARVLQWSFEQPSKDDPVTIVHYPGSNDLSVSFGKVIEVDEKFLKYDADTEGGSSGAPVLDHLWRVVAFHTGRNFDAEKKYSISNFGVGRPAFLEALQRSESWPSIAAFHRIADDRTARLSLQSDAVSAAAAAPDAVLVRAALVPNMDRVSLSDEQTSLLGDLVADPKALKWALPLAERRRIIESVGSLEALRRHFRPSENPDAAERVVKDILDGPPYHFEQADEAELGWWIQITRWFEGVASDLPTPAAISRLLERRRIRSRLDKITDGEFRGRIAELKKLREWYKKSNGPALVTGIGGIGKSSVVAHFASELPAETLLLWLDFDRADLAPDDAVSVLSAISVQASVQLDGFDPPKIDSKNWQAGAETLGQKLASAAGQSFPPLVVLDSFEAAQYSTRYQEIWPVLESLSRNLPELRVCVTGRAPVPGLKLRGKAAYPIKLEGIEDPDARIWLAAHGVNVPEVVERVVQLASGIPLVIRLALRFIEVGGKVEDLPRELPQKIVAGYLYDRILDRVQNPEIKPLASAILVVRRITVDMFMPLFEGIVTFPPGGPDEWFAAISREMALVEGGEALQPRPELRAATLSLLEREKPDMVRSVDERAARWYAALNDNSVETAAELVYHCLRLGDVAGAEKAWRDGAGAFLTFAVDDIRGAQAHDWLLGRLGAPPESSDLELWELEAAERIRSARQRNHDRTVKEILRERSGRSERSPLLFHDAYEQFTAGNLQAAYGVLREATDVPGAIGRDRVALRALIARAQGNLRGADALLARIGKPELWGDGNQGRLRALAVQAARIRLSVDIDAEIRLLERGGPFGPLLPMDVVSPALRQVLGRDIVALESMMPGLEIEHVPALEIQKQIEDERTARLRGSEWSRPIEWSPERMWEEASSYVGPGSIYADEIPAAELLLASRRRWWIAGENSFLQACCRELFEKPADSSSPLAAPLLGTLATFASDTPTFFLRYRDFPLSHCVLNSAIVHEPIPIRQDAWEQVSRKIRSVLEPGFDPAKYEKQQDGYVTLWLRALMEFGNRKMKPEDVAFFLLFVTTPDPLDLLVADIAISPGLRG